MDKNTNDILRESNARLNLAMNAAHMAWWEMDISTGNVVFDKHKTEMLGYDAAEFTHFKDFMALVHLEDVSKAMQAMHNHIDGSMDKYEVEYRIRTNVGDYKWFHDIGSITQRDDEGKPLKVAGLVIDISERKQMELEFNANNERFQSVADHVSAFIAYVNVDTLKYEFVNKMFVDSFGMPREKIIGSHVRDVIGEDNYKYAIKYIEMVRSGKKASYENTFMVASGRRWIDVNYSPVFDSNGKVTSIVVMSYDVTERKQREAQLRNLQKAIEESHDIVFITDTEGIITFINSSFTAIYGFTAQEVVGKVTPRILNSGKSTKEMHTTYWNAMLKGLELRHEYQNKCKDGSLIDIEGSASAIYDEQKNIIGFLAIQRDITQHKREEQELIKTNRRLEQLNSFFVDRENRMIELKQEINELCVRLGEEKPYMW